MQPPEGDLHVHPGDSVLTREYPVGTVWDILAEVAQFHQTNSSPEKILPYVEKFAPRWNGRVERDKAGNLLVTVPPGSNSAEAPGVLVQCQLDFDILEETSLFPERIGFSANDSGQRDMYIDAEQHARGIANAVKTALMLSLLTERFPHGPFALLFTHRKGRAYRSADHLSLKNPLAGYSYFLSIDSAEPDVAITGNVRQETDSNISTPVFDPWSENSSLNTLAFQIWKAVTRRELSFFATFGTLDVEAVKRYFSSADLNALSLGPKTLRSGRPEESVRVQDVVDMYKFLKTFLKSVSQLRL